MSNDRIAALERMLERAPDDPRALFGLALEHEKLGDWRQVVAYLERYLQRTEDEGNAWGRLAQAQLRLGDDEAARAAWRRGIETAQRHGHPTMAAEFEDALAELD